MKEKIIFNWSGGKDSALCLHKIIASQQYEVNCLLTSVSEQYQRISMHGVRVELLEAQAESIGLPLVKMPIPEKATMEIYDNAVASTLTTLIQGGVTASAFGDIFLEDLRAYRENQLAKLNLKGLFPLWKIPTDRLVREFIDLGFKTIVTCVNAAYLDKSFVGQIIDYDFLKNLPHNVDPCGENGEFHTFVFDAPYFKNPIAFNKGEVVYRKYTSDTESQPDYGFWYCDLLAPQQIEQK